MPSHPPKPRQRERRRLVTLQPDRQTIRDLLLTWPTRQMRGVTVPPPPGDDPEWSWNYEQQYGAPKLKDRESVLGITLKVLSDGGKRDIRAIVAALQRIRHRAFENARLGLTLDLQREGAEESVLIRRNLTKWLARAIRLHQQSNPDDLPTGRRFRHTYEAMLTALTFGELMTEQERASRDWLFAPYPAAMRRRRNSQGNPDASLVKEAHRLLAAVKVPHEQHRDLLWAIGVVDESGHLPRRNLSRK